MKAIATQTELYLDQLRDLLAAQSQISLTMGWLAERSTHGCLNSLLRCHETRTDLQKERIWEVLHRYEHEPNVETCGRVLGMIKGGNKQIKQSNEPSLRDLLIVAHCLRVKHYEVAGYRFVVTLARRARLKQDADRFAKSLNEERELIQDLTALSGELPLPDETSLVAEPHKASYETIPAPRQDADVA